MGPSNQEIADAMRNIIDIETRTIKNMTNGLGIAYREHLNLTMCRDTPTMRIGYYTLVYEIIAENPFPLGNVQTAVLAEVERILEEAKSYLKDEVDINLKSAMGRAKR